MIYSPFIDYLLLGEFLKKGRKIDPKAEFNFSGTTHWQDLINTYDYSRVPEKTLIFSRDSTIGTHAEHSDIEKFKKKNNFSMPTPVPRKQNDSRVLECLALAVMELITKWPAKHNAEKKNYLIEPADSKSKKELAVSGYCLSKALMAVKKEKTEKAVSARIFLEDDFWIQLADVSAYASSASDFESLVREPHELYSIVKGKPLHHGWKGHVDAPCINESYDISDHLKGITYTAKHPHDYHGNRPLEEIRIIGSGARAKLKLSEWGVEARAEGYAIGHMKLVASASGRREPYYPLVITHGLIASIWHVDTPIFLAYIPQEKFELSAN